MSDEHSRRTSLFSCESHKEDRAPLTHHLCPMGKLCIAWNRAPVKRYFYVCLCVCVCMRAYKMLRSGWELPHFVLLPARSWVVKGRFCNRGEYGGLVIAFLGILS